jgi:septum formation protein
LLHQIRVSFDLLLFRSGGRADTEIDETPLHGELPQDYVLRVARSKAHAAVELIQTRRLIPQPVLAADTTIDLDGELIGKPDNAEHALEILRRLSGRRHRVLTAVALADGSHINDVVNESQVRFRPMEGDEIRRYVATGEPLDKAGGYAVQGRAAIFIEEIHGSYSGIMGLPLFETALLLRSFGHQL